MPNWTKTTVVEDEDEDCGSVAAPSPNWGDLPNEVLTKIFCELKIEVDENGKLKSEEEKQALLNCRLMNRRWKDVINDVLEKQCLKFWTEWRPHVNQQDNTGYSHCFAILHLENSPSTDIRYPRFLKTRMLKNSASPTKSVCVTQKPGAGGRLTISRDWIWSDIGVFAKFGHHLTSITFFNLSFPSVEILTLQRILSHTPNLQAMTLQRVKMIVSESDFSSFPSLPKLAHLKLLECDWEDGGKYFMHWSMNFQMVEAYKPRLTSLETHYWYDEVDLESFPILKQLKISMGNDFSFCETLQLPSVSHLCLNKFPIHDMKLVKELPYLLHKSTSTLVQLHIQLDPTDFDSRFQINPAHDSWKPPTLINATSFAVTYPNCPNGLEAVQNLLKMLPNLDELNFIQFDETGESTEGAKEAVKNHLLEMSYWNKCKKLKVVSVSMNTDSSKPFYTRRAPFPK